MMSDVARRVGRVLERDFDPVAVERVLEIGRVTGLREEGGVYRLANFERGLLLYQQIPGLPRCMVLLGGLREGVVMAGWKLFFWRLAGRVMDACYREGMFPLAGRGG